MKRTHLGTKGLFEFLQWVILGAENACEKSDNLIFKVMKHVLQIHFCNTRGTYTTTLRRPLNKCICSTESCVQKREILVWS